MAEVAPVAQWATDRLSDAGGPGFEFQTGRVTGKHTPSHRRDGHPAVLTSSGIRGSHSSSATRLTQVFFKRGE